MAEVTLKNVKKSFGDVDVIHGVDLNINNGEFVVFVGPSGCGKSTLLRLVSGLENVTGGNINIDNKDVTNEEPANRGVAMVFQSYALYPHMSVYDNMAFGLKMTGYDKETINQRVQKAAEILELKKLLNRKPKAMSGGQRQRVAIGRAIVREPKVFLFDEPLSNLDAELRVQMRLEIAKLHNDLSATMIYVTHDQTEAMTLADKIVVLKDGLVEQVGSPLELYDNPDNEFVAGFIGSPRMNFLDGEIISTKGDKAEIKINNIKDVKLSVRMRGDAKNEPKQVKVGIRPEHFINPENTKHTFDAKTLVVEQLGGVSYLYLDVGGEQVTVEQKGHSKIQGNQTAQIGINPDNVLLFNQNGSRI